MSGVVVVAGGGPAALWVALELVHAGRPVELVCSTPPERGTRFSTGLLTGSTPPGDVARWTPVLESARAVAVTLDRLGVPFERTPEGRPRLVDAPGRVHAGPHTGLHLQRALASQVRAAQSAGQLVLHDHHALLEVTVVDGGVRGVMVADAWRGTVARIHADALCLAEERTEALHDGATAGPGDAVGALHTALQAGAAWEDPDLARWHGCAPVGASWWPAWEGGGHMAAMGSVGGLVTDPQGRCMGVTGLWAAGGCALAVREVDALPGAATTWDLGCARLVGRALAAAQGGSAAAHSDDLNGWPARLDALGDGAGPETVAAVQQQVDALCARVLGRARSGEALAAASEELRTLADRAAAAAVGGRGSPGVMAAERLRRRVALLGPVMTAARHRAEGEGRARVKAVDGAFQLEWERA
ncbi:MAG: FAD-binding protein [Deltaproteobacteria bacterium]|nr:FAD-binding protein [Deltaproteobacteria bacterium]